jgi:hypothetical protein
MLIDFSRSRVTRSLLALSATITLAACGSSDPQPGVPAPNNDAGSDAATGPNPGAVDGATNPVDGGAPDSDGKDSDAPSDGGRTKDAPIVATPIVPPFVFGKTAWGGVSPGMGVDLTSDAFTGACLTGPLRVIPILISTTSAPEELTSGDALLDKLLGSAKGEVTLRSVSTVRAAAAQMAEDPTELESLSLWARRDTGIALDDSQKLSASPGATCPADFALEVQWGALFAYGLKVRFADVNARAEFAKVYSEGANLVRQRDAHEIGWIGYDWKDKATVQLVAFQAGGKPETLKALLDASKCTIGNLVACKETLGQIDQYASTTLMTDLGPSPTPSDGQGWIALAVTTRDVASALKP